MHWKELLLGSELYYKHEGRANYYKEYMDKKRWENWQYPDIPDEEVEKLFKFLKQWYMQFLPIGPKAITGFQQAYRESFPILKEIADVKLLSVNFNDYLLQDTKCSLIIKKLFKLPYLIPRP